MQLSAQSTDKRLSHTDIMSFYPFTYMQHGMNKILMTEQKERIAKAVSLSVRSVYTHSRRIRVMVGLGLVLAHGQLCNTFQWKCVHGRPCI